MATLVTAWSSNIGHIADDSGLGVVKTRCGRTLKTFHYQGGSIDCSRCGSEADFENIRNEMHQIYIEQRQARERHHQKQQAENKHRLSVHRQYMIDFEDLLIHYGAEIIESKEAPAGGMIRFKVNDLVFELRGNIWDRS